MTNIMERTGMTKHIVCIFGASGSGKDTMANVLTRRNFLERKYARPMKEFVESCYNLKRGTLDTQEGKAKKLPNSDKTFADLLVGAYHFWQSFDDAMTARNVTKDIWELTTQSPRNVVITDMRKSCEADLLSAYMNESDVYGDDPDSNIKLHLVVISGRGSTLSTDKEQEACLDKLKDYRWSYYDIDNSKDLEYFRKQVDSFIVNELSANGLRL